MNEDKKLQRFLKNYDIHVESDSKRCHRYYGNRMPEVEFFKDPTDASICHSNYAIEYEKMYTISIPESRLKALVELEDRISRYHHRPRDMDMLSVLMDKERQEASLRHQNEGIRKAWEQYSMLLHLAGYQREY